MLSFAHPELLVLLAAVPLVLRWQSRGRSAAIRFPNVEALRTLPRGRADFVRRAGMILRGLVLTLLAVAAAGPRLPDLKTRLPSEGVAMAIVIDVSGSMGTPDFGSANESQVSRLDAAKSAFTTFVESRPGDSIGLVAFAAWPRTECPPTLNHSVLLRMLIQLSPRSGVDAGTNIGDALADGLLRLQASSAKRKVLILLSDGEHNATGTGADAPLTPRQAAQLAANLNIPVYAIDCGGDPEKVIAADAKQQRQDGRTVLQSVADLTRGTLFVADDATQLQQTMKQIDSLERSTIESYQYRRYRDYGRWCGVAAVAVLIVLLLLEATTWRQVPS
ncbi:VWA domain-containing protein [soil metagenome]